MNAHAALIVLVLLIVANAAMGKLEKRTAERLWSSSYRAWVKNHER